ncbi:ribose 5-phosphate isomerase A [Shouchella clausii]|uniref:ribose-5-phosphate isomerase RpiA n=1 Tax=Shouchella TaxID=2893057 RepID=UPI000BA5097A|nr:ribose-5-phosphate isomerase RpiA [Shouchella clausii]MDO7266326.1 ribose-5-phosphate isomerase RpiA [Shouchella clausii]MDO7286759.1 ribose-5-phosphate isomerase RpiA [Shouchella clausii]PAF14998.1 ribose 5-phosphate isomerase A [Shouchella clausii]
MDQLKRMAAEAAAEYVKDGMKIGLGSGSTVFEFVRVLGEKAKEGLNIQAVAASRKTEALAKACGIHIIDFPTKEKLEVAFDGADEIAPGLMLLKGGGGSLLREKLVAAAAKRLVVLADESKLVEELGAFKLPVEIIPFGWETTALRIEALGGVASLRQTDQSPFVSDNHNWILDCDFGNIRDPYSLHEKVKKLVGVVETGLFLDMACEAIVASKNGIHHITKGDEFNV